METVTFAINVFSYSLSQTLFNMETLTFMFMYLSRGLYQTFV